MWVSPLWGCRARRFELGELSVELDMKTLVVGTVALAAVAAVAVVTIAYSQQAAGPRPGQTRPRARFRHSLRLPRA